MVQPRERGRGGKGGAWGWAGPGGVCRGAARGGVGEEGHWAQPPPRRVGATEETGGGVWGASGGDGDSWGCCAEFRLVGPALDPPTASAASGTGICIWGERPIPAIPEPGEVRGALVHRGSSGLFFLLVAVAFLHTGPVPPSRYLWCPLEEGRGQAGGPTRAEMEAPPRSSERGARHL